MNPVTANDRPCRIIELHSPVHIVGLAPHIDDTGIVRGNRPFQVFSKSVEGIIRTLEVHRFVADSLIVDRRGEDNQFAYCWTKFLKDSVDIRFVIFVSADDLRCLFPGRKHTGISIERHAGIVHSDHQNCHGRPISQNVGIHPADEAVGSVSCNTQIEEIHFHRRISCQVIARDVVVIVPSMRDAVADEINAITCPQ